MAFLDEMDPATGFLDRTKISEKGQELHAQYQAAEPFPHIVIEDFLPRPILDMCLREFRPEGQEDHTLWNRDQERLKRDYKPDRMSPAARTLFYAFNSLPFVNLIQNITGIKQLIPDPHFLGAGFHEVQNGGHLDVHADFNYHRYLNLERRINVIIYLNEDWREEYGGQLELWDEKMTHCVKSFVPEINRCVIFNTTSNSYHGNPRTVNHPNGVSRKSIALYYYTSTWDSSKRSHDTQFRVRPGSKDRFDVQVRRREFFEDFTPPILFRAAKRAKRLVTGGAGR